jgi:hypothetical protein
VNMVPGDYRHRRLPLASWRVACREALCVFSGTRLQRGQFKLPHPRMAMAPAGPGRTVCFPILWGWAATISGFVD